MLVLSCAAFLSSLIVAWRCGLILSCEVLPSVRDCLLLVRAYLVLFIMAGISGRSTEVIEMVMLCKFVLCSVLLDYLCIVSLR